jgi:hypothetical protein
VPEPTGLRDVERGRHCNSVASYMGVGAEHFSSGDLSSFRNPIVGL